MTSFHSGYGLLVGAFAGCFSIITYVLSAIITGNGVYFETHRWPIGVAVFLSGLACYALGRGLLSKDVEASIDQAQRSQNRTWRPHCLFFIPMIYWGPILMATGTVLLALDLLR